MPQRIEPLADERPALCQDLAEPGHVPGTAGQSREAGNLGDTRRADHVRVVNLQHLRAQPARHDHVAEAPAAHGVDLREGEEVGQPIRELGLARQIEIALTVLVDELRVRVVQQQHQVALDGDPTELEQLLPRKQAAGGVGRVHQHQRLGPVRDEFRQCRQVHGPGVGLVETPWHRHAAAEPDLLNMGSKARVRDDHLVTRLDEHVQERAHALHVAGRDEHVIVRIHFQARLPGVLARSQGPELRQAVRQRVFADVRILGEGGRHRIANVLRGAERRQAPAEAGHVVHAGSQHGHLLDGGEARARHVLRNPVIVPGHSDAHPDRPVVILDQRQHGKRGEIARAGIARLNEMATLMFFGNSLMDSLAGPRNRHVFSLTDTPRAAGGLVVQSTSRLSAETRPILRLSSARV